MLAERPCGGLELGDAGAHRGPAPLLEAVALLGAPLHVGPKVEPLQQLVGGLELAVPPGQGVDPAALGRPGPGHEVVQVARVHAGELPAQL